MSWAIAASFGGSVVGGILAGNAARDAASTQSAAADRATQLQRQQYEQNRLDQQPWREAGVRALGQLESGEFAKNLEMDPGYDFRLKEGQKAIDAASAARGLGNSGATLKSLARYGQDYAANEYSNAYNRQFQNLSQLAGLGTNATNQVGAAGQNYANQAGQNIIGAGNAQAAGQVAGANAFNENLGTAANTWLAYTALNRPSPNTGNQAGQSWNSYRNFA